jgi:hypothetical protein
VSSCGDLSSQLTAPRSLLDTSATPKGTVPGKENPEWIYKLRVTEQSSGRLSLDLLGGEILLLGWVLGPLPPMGPLLEP